MTPILVGLRLGIAAGDQGYRVRNWAYAKARWEAQPGWPIFEGHYDDPGPFSLARASNRAAAAAGDWEVAFYVGADFILADPQQAIDAVECAMTTGQLTFAHDILTQLDESETLYLTGGYDEQHDVHIAGAGATAHPVAEGTRHPNTFSGALAIPRHLWNAVGGFDERFIDWGWDDLAFYAACNALGGGHERIPGDAYHLWHPRSWEQNEGNPQHGANSVLGQRYLAAKSDRRAMLALITERP